MLLVTLNNDISLYATFVAMEVLLEERQYSWMPFVTNTLLVTFVGGVVHFSTVFWAMSEKKCGAQTFYHKIGEHISLQTESPAFMFS